MNSFEARPNGRGAIEYTMIVTNGHLRALHDQNDEYRIRWFEATQKGLGTGTDLLFSALAHAQQLKAARITAGIISPYALTAMVTVFGPDCISYVHHSDTIAQLELEL